MPARPYLKLYVSDYLGDTTHLSTAEHGAYLLLLMAAWNLDGTLPAEPAALARIARCTPKAWAKIYPALAPYFHEEAGRLVNFRLLKEHEKASENRDQKSRAGIMGAVAKAMKNNDTPQANASENDKQTASKHPGKPESRVQSPENPDSNESAEKVLEQLRKFPDGEFDGWNMCLSVLRYLGGISEPKARSLIGKMKRDFKVDNSGLAEIAQATWEAKSRDPVPFMLKCAEKRGEEAEYVRPVEVERRMVREFVERAASWDYRSGPAPDQRFCKISPGVLAEFGFEVLK